MKSGWALPILVGGAKAMWDEWAKTTSGIFSGVRTGPSTVLMLQVKVGSYTHGGEHGATRERVLHVIWGEEEDD